MLAPHELKRLRAGFLAKADENMSRLARENQDILPKLNAALLAQLKTRDILGISSAAYRLFCSAQNLGRQDITNVAEMLYKAINKPKFAQEEAVLAVFEQALEQLAARDQPDLDLESKISITIYDVLRKINDAP